MSSATGWIWPSTGKPFRNPPLPAGHKGRRAPMPFSLFLTIEPARGSGRRLPHPPPDAGLALASAPPRRSNFDQPRDGLHNIFAISAAGAGSPNLAGAPKGGPGERFGWFRRAFPGWHDSCFDLESFRALGPNLHTFRRDGRTAGRLGEADAVEPGWERRFLPGPGRSGPGAGPDGRRILEVSGARQADRANGALEADSLAHGSNRRGRRPVSNSHVINVITRTMVRK